MGFFDNLMDEEDKEWQKAQERQQELESRPKVKLNQLNCENADTVGEEKEASWLISRANQGITLNRDEETGKYVIFLQVDTNSEAILLDVKDLSEAKKITEKLILNLQLAKTFSKKLEAPDGERVRIAEYNSNIPARRIKSESQILLDGKPLETTRKAGDILLEHANVGQNGDRVIDFQTAGYINATHVCLMKRLYKEQILLTDEQKEGVTHYKNAGFMVMNGLLRGGQKNFEMIIDKILNSEYKTPLDIITKYILDIEDIAKVLPQRSFDVILHRKGSGVGKAVQEGSKNEYNSLVSFATNEGMRTGDSPENYVEYQYRLKKDVPAVPIEILCPEALRSYHPECEIFTLPFSYEVEKYNEKYRDMHDGDYEALVTIGNVKNIPITKLLEVRLPELSDYLKKLSTDRAYVDDLLTKTQSSESTKVFISAGYEENEDVEQISLLEMLNSFKEIGKLKDVIDYDKKIQNDPNQYESYTHGANHTRRVGFFARVIGENIGLSKEDMELLLYAVQNHDIGRTHDLEDKEHGEKSVERLKQIRKENNSDKWESNKPDYFSFDDRDLIFFMIENHSKSVRENEQAIAMLPEYKQDRYRLMLNCLKDADKLDRIRLGKDDGLDATRLQLPFSQKIVRMAYEVNYIWTDIADRLDSKLYDVDSIIPSVDKAIEIVQDRIQNPVKNEIGKRKIEYYDDSVIEAEELTENNTDTEKTPEEVLGGIIKKSERQTTISCIKQLIINIKNKAIAFFKGGQKSDKSEEVK